MSRNKIGLDKEKLKARKKKYYLDNREKLLREEKERRINNKEKYKQKGRKTYNKNKDKILLGAALYYIKNKDKYLKNLYNISLDDYNRLFNFQEGKCAICGKHQSELKKSLAVDHDHSNSQIRGLLCGNCNIGIGYLEDNSSILDKASKYLKNYGK